MAQDSAIEWTDATWNPVTGCTKISPDAKTATHIGWRGGYMPWVRRGTGIISLSLYNDDLLEQPLRWNQPRKIFVNSISDLFHHDVPLEFIQ